MKSDKEITTFRAVKLAFEKIGGTTTAGTIRRKIKAGKIKAVKKNGRWRINENDFISYLSGNCWPKLYCGKGKPKIETRIIQEIDSGKYTSIEQVVYDAWCKFDKANPILNGVASFDDIYKLLPDNIKTKDFQEALLKLEKMGRFGLYTSSNYRDYNSKTSISSKRGVLSWIDPRVDAGKCVFNTVKAMVHHATVVPIPKIRERVIERFGVSESVFEDILRNLENNIRFESASSTDEKGGIFIDGIYYLYATGVFSEPGKVGPMLRPLIVRQGGGGNVSHVGKKKTSGQKTRIRKKKLVAKRMPRLIRKKIMPNSKQSFTRQ